MAGGEEEEEEERDLVQDIVAKLFPGWTSTGELDLLRK